MAAFPFNRPQWLGLVRAAPIPAGYIGSRWFPFENVASDELVNFIKLARNPLAPYVALDADIPKIPDDVYREIRTTIAYIRYRKEFSEKDLRIFNEVASGEASLVTQGQRERRRQVQNFAELLSQAVDGTIEKQRMDLIYTGQITNDWEADRKYPLSIVFPGVHSFTASPLWDQGSSDPIADLKSWIKTIWDASTVRPRVLTLSIDIIWTLASNSAFVALWNASRGAGAEATSLTPTQASTFLGEILALEIIEYAAQYTTITYDATSGEPTINKHDMVDVKKLALLPNVPVGNTATSPDEENGWLPGRYSWGPIRSPKPPRTYEVGAGQNAMTRCNFPNQLGYATVLAAEV